MAMPVDEPSPTSGAAASHGDILGSSSLERESTLANGPVPSLPSTVVMRSLSPTQSNPVKGDLMANLSESTNGKAKRESLKVQKKVYRIEKKRAAKEIISTLRDPTVVLMADYLKVRGMLKSWTKFWCVLKPGALILYKSQKQKSGHWVGTIVLNSAELIERPSKKDGFCFKIYHPLDLSIWAQRGPKGETYGALTQPLMYSSAIFRALSETAGKTWMESLELALRCSSLLAPVPSAGLSKQGGHMDSSHNDTSAAYDTHNDELNDSDREDHFKDLKECPNSRAEGVTECSDDSDSTSITDSEDEVNSNEYLNAPPVETTYVENECDIVSKGGAGDLSEEFADENKNIIWCLMKQVRVGMDLSKVTLPTFILEPRSLLEKFADYYYHCDILSRAAKCDDAMTRMKEVVRWYVSGFYKTPKGVKKPYNPILGEKFRCYFNNEETHSKTFYIAEQISHHPPVSAFYITNRHDGFSINCAVLSKSKFYGNSVAAVMDGVGKLTFLKLGEEYSITIPYGYAKGIITGSLTMELGGKVSIECDKTGYKTDLEFKLKPFMGGSGSCNKISGKIKLGSETLFTLDGRWDQEVFIKDRTSGCVETFWRVDNETLSNRLKRYTVPPDSQEELESERLWQHVSEALKESDQTKATHEKFLLEEAQRNAAKERKVTNTKYEPALFEIDKITGCWIYKYSDLRPWDPVNDITQYEKDFMALTHTKHKTPLVRQMSIVNVNSGEASTRSKQHRVRSLRSRGNKVSDSSTPSHISDAEIPTKQGELATNNRHTSCAAEEEGEITLAVLRKAQQESNNRLHNLQSIAVQIATHQQRGIFLQTRDWIILALILCLQTFMQFIFSRY